MTKYVYPLSNANSVSKHGIKLKVYGLVADDIGFSRVSVDEGHFEEFKHALGLFTTFSGEMV